MTIPYDVLEPTITFVLAGFIMNGIFSYYFPLERNQTNTAVLRFLFFGMVNWLIVLAIAKISPNVTKNIPFVGFICPIVLSLLILRCGKTEKVKRILNYLGVNMNYFIPNSWNYIFYDVSKKDGAYLIITLKDYSEIYAYWGSQSFASSTGENDIYLEKIFSDSNFQKEVDGGGGMLLFGREILSINFYRKEEGVEENGN